jgi:hypothetical protein
MIKKTLFTLTLITAACMGASAPALAAPPGAWVDVAPPRPRAEAVPAPRRDYVWVPGYWNWTGRRHVWVPGTWMRERRGYVYGQPQWVQRDGRWELHRGGWKRGDRDGDGVPNSRDSRPHNPRRN